MEQAQSSDLISTPPALTVFAVALLLVMGVAVHVLAPDRSESQCSGANEMWRMRM